MLYPIELRALLNPGNYARIQTDIKMESPQIRAHGADGARDPLEPEGQQLSRT
jgi:hypothetical protein